MSALYIHVPFCASRCAYCAFYSTTAAGALRHRYVEALRAELLARRSYLPPDPLRSVYWGGGTPSQLPLGDVEAVFATIAEAYGWQPGAEITLEANPDDVSEAWCAGLSRLPVNRVSLGVQSFSDVQLRAIGRRHTGAQAVQAVERLSRHGLTNVSIDLIYGLPGQTLSDFERDVAHALALPITHLSAYALSFEPHTPLWRQLRQGRVSETDEETQRAMFDALMRLTDRAGWEHYEISNFARPGFAAVHNTAYWTGAPYLGCGPGAHSYNGRERRWNDPDLSAYVARPGHPPHGGEVLTEADQYNDYVLTALRLPRGIDVDEVARRFGTGRAAALLAAARRSIAARHLAHEGHRLYLLREGWFIADEVASDLFWCPDEEP